MNDLASRQPFSKPQAFGQMLKRGSVKPEAAEDLAGKLFAEFKKLNPRYDSVLMLRTNKLLPAEAVEALRNKLDIWTGFGGLLVVLGPGQDLSEMSDAAIRDLWEYLKARFEGKGKKGG